MGIHKLMDLIRSEADDSIKRRFLSYYSGMIFALDASMSMYQFLVSTQGVSSDQNFLTTLTDAQGNKTGHLLGLLNRTMAMIQNGIKPVWVFDGKAPTKKNGQLLRRRKVKQQATEKKEDAEEIGDLAEALKQQQRTTYISKKQREDAMTMLKLLGIPVILAPGQAEAQCSYMSKQGKVDVVCTEDTDSLVFGTKLLLREMNTKNEPLCQITRQTVLSSLKLTEQQFTDMCILCGCDYASKIQGIGPVKAYKFIKQFHSIEKILEHCENENKLNPDKEKYHIPKKEDFDYEEVRNLFKNPAVTDEYELKWQKNVDEEAVKKFLIGQKNFAENRVESILKKIKVKRGIQPRLENFFKPAIITNPRKQIQWDKKQQGKNKNKSKSIKKK